MNVTAKIHNERGLSLDLIARQVPSVFAESPAGNVSDKYVFLPTRPVLERLMEKGWVVTSAQAQMSGRGRKRVPSPHGAHMLRIRHESVDPMAEENKDGYPDIVVFNSHDRSKRWSFGAGIFRCVCVNGLISGDIAFRRVITHIHVRDTMDQIVESVSAIADRMPEIRMQVIAMKDKTLTSAEQIEFGRRAIDIRYRGFETSLSATTLIENVRRNEDEGPSLWRVFNRVQEHLMVGGLSTGKRHTQPMTSLYESTMLNQRLWSMAGEFLSRN